MIQRVYVQRTDDPEAVALLARLQGHGFPELAGLTIERSFWLEGDVDPGRLLPLLVNPLYQSASRESQLDPSKGPIVEVLYQRAVTDPETPSIFDGAAALGVEGLEWARIGLRYQFPSTSQEVADQIARQFLYNPVVQAVMLPGESWDSLYPSGSPEPLETISLIGLAEDQLVEMSQEKRWNAPLSQMKALQAKEQAMGRPWTDVEIEMIVQAWCDHCYHTTWKSLGLLKLLQDATAKINHPLLVSAYSDNAGAFLFYEDWVILIKGETHNHPSSIATLGGILTKHGGVIRDIIFFGRGGYPIGGSTIMGTMDPRISWAKVPKGALHPRTIVLESIAGTAGYLNPMGIPMMQPIYRVHPGFPKCFALGHTLGLAPRKYALKEPPQKGDAVILIGGRTGRDGIHGATGSSGELTHEVITRWAAEVQIGHPITERKFTTAIPALRDTGCIRTCTDLGAGGISCAVGELTAETGVRLDISKVPLKDTSLADWEIMLSESQERGLLCVPPEKVEEALSILRLYNVEATIIGEITGDHKFTVYNGERLVAEIEMDFLWGACPIDKVEIREPERKLQPVSVPVPSGPKAWEGAATRVLSHYHCCDQSAAGFQFDQTVQGRTVIGPYGGKNGRMPTNVGLSAPLRGKPYGTGMTIGWKPFYGEVDPAGMARLAVVEAVSQAVAVGVNPAEIFLSSNFYTPRLTPEVGWDLKRMVETLAETKVVLGTPIIVGKDSSSGTFRTADGESINVPYTLVIAATFRMPDVRRAVTKEFKRDGNLLVWLGPWQPEALGGSVYLDCYGQRGDKLPDPDLPTLLAIYRRLHEIYQLEPNPIKAATAIGDGGLFVRLFEMAYGSELGAMVTLAPLGPGRMDGRLFGEAIGSIILEIEPNTEVLRAFEGLPFRLIGEVQESSQLRIWHMEDAPPLNISDREPEFCIGTDELARVWEKTFAEVVR